MKQHYDVTGSSQIFSKFSTALLVNHLNSLTQLIQRDKNRPSVIMWSVANEPRTQHKESADYFRCVSFLIAKSYSFSVART